MSDELIKQKLYIGTAGFIEAIRPNFYFLFTIIKAVDSLAIFTFSIKVTDRRFFEFANKTANIKYKNA